MRKILGVVLAVVCLLSLAGCGGGTPKAETPAPKQEKVLRVGTAANYPPFEYFQKASNTFTGFDIELMQGVAQEMGCSKVEFVNLEFEKLLPSLKDKQIDAIISCMTITEGRLKDMDFTEPYLDSGFVMVSRSDIEDKSLSAILGKKIAAEKGTLSVTAAKEYTKDVMECGSAEECLKLVADKKADFAMMDHYAGRFYVTNTFNGKLTVMTELHDARDKGIAIAVAKGNKELLGKLNEGLGKYRTTADFQQLKNTYFGKLRYKG